MKYVDAKVVFREVPDEITLALNISHCPVHCPGCHSKYLWDDVGAVLDSDALSDLIKRNMGISCVSFMGGDAEPGMISEFASFIKENFPSLKVCWYSGRDVSGDEAKEMFPEQIRNLDYVKFGPYVETLGGLDNPSTNQHFYRILHSQFEDKLEDITASFWNSNI